MNFLFKSFYDWTLAALKAAKDHRSLKAVCQKSYLELDKAFEKELTQSGSKIACCMGCFYCCHIKIDVLPAEAFLIADFIREKFSSERRDVIVKKAKANWEKIEPMSCKEQSFANLACPLLENGCCSVYSVRPSLCRVYHSTQVAPCKGAFEHPEQLSGPDYTIPNVRIATATATIGIAKAFDAMGHDAQPYDINPAIIECLTNPHAERRWQHGKSAFPKNMLAKEMRAQQNVQPIK